MKPLTNTIPKPLISIAWKPILTYNLEHIYKSVDEIIIVIKYLWEQIRQYFWDNFEGTKITYFEQWDDKWTAAALRWIQCSDDVFIIYWDQILEKKDYDTILNYKWYWALAKKISEPSKYWIYKLDKKWFAQELVEKPSENIWNLANIWGFKFSSEIFSIVKNIKLSSRGEYEIPDALNIFLIQNKFKIFEAEWEFIDVWCPEDIPKAEKVLELWNNMNSLTYIKPHFGDYSVLEQEDDYIITLWIPKHQISTLITYSQDLTDTELQENTWDLKRFASEEKLKRWYSDKNRYLFCMLDWDNNLAGIYWWRPTKFPTIKEVVNQDAYNIVEQNINNIHTNWIRIYPHYRWKGLAKFLFKAENHYENIFPSPYWSTDINQENIASCKGFERKWYTHIANWKNINNGKAEDNNRRIYVKIPK